MATDLASAQAKQELALLKDTNTIVLRPGLALVSIIALVCLSLQTELLQQIDSMHRYLRFREIALEAGMALLFCLAIACCWWLFVLLMGKVASTLLPQKQRICIHLCWDLWIAVPLAGLILEVFQDFKLEFIPHWHAGTNVQIAVGFGLVGLCVAGLSVTGWPKLQRFCFTRLAPIAWAHIAIAIVAAGVLWLHGVHFFHDYEHPSNAALDSKLPDIYLITIDALRASDTSVYGYPRATTPSLEKFAQRSFTFDYDFANSNFTTATTSSIETGKLPWSHRVFHLGGFLRDRNQHDNLAAILKQRGYYTAMISANLLAAPFHHRTLDSYNAVEYASPMGLAGFRFRETNVVGLNTQFTVAISLIRPLTTMVEWLDRMTWGYKYPSPAEDVFNRAGKLLERHKSVQPMFLWAHIMPPHDPYWVPPPYQHHFGSGQARNYDDYKVPDSLKPFRGVTVQELHDAYDEMILYADHTVGEFLGWLDQTGRLDRSIVIISSDHGEMFDHRRLSHGGPELYNSVIRVPLLIHLPEQTKSVRVEEASQQVDLLSTVLDLIGAPIPKWSEGTSLKPLLEGGKLEDRYIFSMNLEPNRIFDPITKGTVAVMDGEYKFVRYLDSGREQLYRYRTDNNEEHDLAQSEPEVAARMRKVLLDKIGEVNRQFTGKP